MDASPHPKPWKQKNPRKKEERTALTAESKAWARAAAARAGRRYPNLIDNMRAAGRQKQQASDEADGDTRRRGL